MKVCIRVSSNLDTMGAMDTLPPSNGRPFPSDWCGKHVSLLVRLIYLCTKLMTQYLHYQLMNWHVLKRTLCL